MKTRQSLAFRNTVVVLAIGGSCTSLACQKAETDQNSGAKRAPYATVSLDGFNDVLTSKQPLIVTISQQENNESPTGKAEISASLGKDTVVGIAFLVDPSAENKLTGSYDLSGNRGNQFAIGVQLRRDSTSSYRSVEGTITLVQKGNDVSGSFKTRMLLFHAPGKEIVPTDAAEEISLSGSLQAKVSVFCGVSDPEHGTATKRDDSQWASPFCQSMIRWRSTKYE